MSWVINPDIPSGPAVRVDQALQRHTYGTNSRDKVINENFERIFAAVNAQAEQIEDLDRRVKKLHRRIAKLEAKRG